MLTVSQWLLATAFVLLALGALLWVIKSARR